MLFGQCLKKFFDLLENGRLSYQKHNYLFFNTKCLIPVYQSIRESPPFGLALWLLVLKFSFWNKTDINVKKGFDIQGCHHRDGCN